MVAIAGVVVLAYLSFGVVVYVQGLQAKLSIHICPPGVFPEIQTMQVMDGTSQTVTQIPDCPTQSLRVANELRTAPVVIFGWLPLMIARISMESEPGVGKDMPINTNPPPITDGINVQGLGIFHDSPVENRVKAYQSERLGISFNYPTDYLLFEGKGEGVGGAEYYVITVVPDSTYLHGTIAGINRDSEWPPSIHLAFYREPNLSISLEQWIRTKSQSNFVPSDLAQEGTLTSTTVAGVPALKYRVRGLYDSDYIAFTYGEWVVLAAADDVRFTTDLEAILKSIKSTTVSFWEDTNIKCLPSGHENVSVYSYVALEIFVNGQQEVVPADIGISPICMAEVHTHKSGNKVHIETVEADTQFTLGDLYLVWGQESNRSGFGLKVFVDGEKMWGPVIDDMKIERPEDILLKDGQMIRLEYTNKG